LLLVAERTKFDKSTGLAKADWDEHDPDEPVPLTDEEKMMLIVRLRKARRQTTPQHFGDATTWVLYVFGWMLLKDDPDAPWSYGARFTDFANYIEHRRAERREQEDEETDPAYA
jgi:hypothetical protein